MPSDDDAMRHEAAERLRAIAPHPASRDGAALIAAERTRQQTVEDWTPEHDDRHIDGQLAIAAACYATPRVRRQITHTGAPYLWPWDSSWWKPCHDDRVRELIKAGALIAAEIDRLHRSTGASDDVRALLGAADPTTQKTKLDRVHAMLDRLRPHLPADLFGELAAIIYISDRPMTADDIRRGQEVAQLLDNPDAARNPTDPTLDVSLSPNIKEALRRNALNGNPIVLFGVEYIPAKPTLMQRLVDATVSPLAADPTPVDTVSHRLEELAALEQGWDSYGAYPMQPGIHERTAELLAVLREQPRISLTPSGGAYLTWGSDEDVIVELEPDGTVTALIEDRDIGGPEPVKISCPDCVQWSVEGPTAAEQLINHWALIHMRRVSWTAADGGPTIWPPPETCSCGRALPCRHCTQETT